MATDIKNSSLVTGLVSYWSFDGNSNDLHGSNNGTDNSITYGAGLIDDAAQTDNAADDITVADNASLDVTELGISFWIKTTHSGSNVNLLSRYDDATDRSFRIEMTTTGTVRGLVYLSDNTNSPTVATAASNNDSWTHIVFNAYVDGSDLDVEIYRNGTLAASDTAIGGSSVQQTASSLIMLGATGVVSGIGTAELDEAGYWNRRLTSTDVTDLYNGGSGIPYDAGTVFTPKVIMF